MSKDCMISFNSILVRLKGFTTATAGARVFLFQFHTGSIKSLRNRFKHANTRKFQFHTGSIKSLRSIGD